MAESAGAAVATAPVERLVAIFHTDAAWRARLVEAAEIIGAGHACCHDAGEWVRRLRQPGAVGVVADPLDAGAKDALAELDAAAAEPPLVVVDSSDKPTGAPRPSAWRVLSGGARLDMVSLVLREATDEALRRASDRRAVEAYYRDAARLSDDERTVMAAVCAGKLNKQIARDLGVSVRTVEQRRRRVFSKMAVDSAVPLASRVATVRTIERFRPKLRQRLQHAAAAGADPPKLAFT
ncbi:MAG: LuxR C-terminal-related transcriptional regulator [Planctomycetota bacterium]